MTERTLAEQAARQLMEALMPVQLPCVIIIGLPKTAEIVCVANGLQLRENREQLSKAMLELLEAAEQGSKEQPCPACLGQGCQHLAEVPGAEPIVCVHCKGTGRITP